MASGPSELDLIVELLDFEAGGEIGDVPSADDVSAGQEGGAIGSERGAADHPVVVGEVAERLGGFGVPNRGDEIGKAFASDDVLAVGRISGRVEKAELDEEFFAEFEGGCAKEANKAILPGDQKDLAIGRELNRRDRAGIREEVMEAFAGLLIEDDRYGVR